MAYFLDDDCIIFDIEQNPVITHAQPIPKIRLAQPLDVARRAFSRREIFLMICAAAVFGKALRFSIASGAYSIWNRLAAMLD